MTFGADQQVPLGPHQVAALRAILRLRDPAQPDVHAAVEADRGASFSSSHTAHALRRLERRGLVFKSVGRWWATAAGREYLEELTP